MAGDEVVTEPRLFPPGRPMAAGKPLPLADALEQRLVVFRIALLGGYAGTGLGGLVGFAIIEHCLVVALNPRRSAPCARPSSSRFRPLDRRRSSRHARSRRDLAIAAPSRARTSRLHRGSWFPAICPLNARRVAGLGRPCRLGRGAPLV